MRTIAGSLPQKKRGNWLSSLGAKLQRTGRRAVAREAHPIVQADAAAFVSAFMRVG